jgi:hypothetical protein
MRPFKACGGFLPAGRRFRTCAGNWAPPLCGSAYGRRRLEGTVVTTVGSAPPPSRHRRPRALGQKTAGGKPKGQGHGGNGQQAGVGRPPPEPSGATSKAEEASLLSHRDRGDAGARGRKMDPGNGLAIERTAGLGCPSNWSPGQRCPALAPDPERIRAIAQRSVRSGV